MNTNLTALIVAVGCAFGAQAVAAPASMSSCFRTQDMRNHTVVDNHTIYVGVGHNEVYRIGTSGSCFSGSASSDALLISTTASSGLVCKPIDLDLGVRPNGPGGIPTHCIVNSVTKLTPAEVAAIPRKLKP